MKLSFQEKGAHIIVGTFPHSRAREVFCEVKHFISSISLTPKSKFRFLKELVKRATRAHSSKCLAVAEKSTKFEDFGKIVKMNKKR